MITAPKASGDGVAVTADGKVLVADASARALRRYGPDGTPDPSFGGDGVVSVTGVPAALAIGDGGRIVLAGTIIDPVRPETDVWVARYAADGTPDASFGGGTGQVLVANPAGGDASASALALSPDGIVAAGTTNFDEFSVVRVTDAGVPDASFGTGGFVSLNVGSDYQAAQGVAVQASGRIVLSGQNAGSLVLAGLTRSGALDPTFATGGVLTTALGDYAGAAGLALTPDGRIVVGGYGTNFLVARFDSDGAFDPTCSGDGVFEVPFAAESSQAYAVAVQPDGKVVAVGRAGDDIALARLLPDCSLDTTFSGDGMRTESFQEGGGAARRAAAVIPTQASALAFQADGRFVVAGRAPGDTNTLYLLRYLGDPPAVLPPPASTPPVTPLTPPATPAPAPAACMSDRTKPELSIVSLQGKVHYGLGQTASVRILASDPGGLVVDPSVASRRLSTAKVGVFTVRAAARDRCGNPAEAGFSYRVVARPTIAVSGVRASCVTRDFVVRVRARSGLGVRRLVIRRDRRVLVSTTTPSQRLVVRAARLPRGRYTLVVTVTDRAGNATTTRAIFARCATVKPVFTG